MLEGKFEIIELVDTYGSLLTKTKEEIIKDYYLYDISLGEIAQSRNISRQAVHDSISKSIDKLKIYEQNLKIIHKKKCLTKLFDEEKQKGNLSDAVYEKFLDILEV